MLVSDAQGHRHAAFLDLADSLRAGDLVVVNDSATLPASLPARTAVGEVTLNLSTRFCSRLWLAEPRWSPERPGPLPLGARQRIEVAGQPAELVAAYPGQPRLWFVRLDAERAMTAAGRPIRYAHVPGSYPLRAYQTVFASRPGSAEMPSAGRPFSVRALAHLARAGIRLATLTLHAGVSSLEHDADDLHHVDLPPEPYRVPRVTARAVAHTRAQGGRVIAVGTTVVRALESAFDGTGVASGSGFTRRVVHAGRPPRVVDGLLTGLHEPQSTHLAMLTALAGPLLIRAAYHAAACGPYLWHEFGDVHLILPPRERPR
jgi:S-adenosylmethionine:tRNA ribosyltransferase-isomerase